MKQIKLEVGKTYRSREGEEVKIVRKDYNGWDYWVGSNGEWYYEGGKWSYVTKEHPDDLIEEVASETRHTFGLVPGARTATRYTFAIPEGAKKVTVSQEGNCIIVEMVPDIKEPKPGDVSRSANTDAMQMSEQNTKYELDGIHKNHLIQIIGRLVKICDRYEKERQGLYEDELVTLNDAKFQLRLSANERG